MAAPRRFLQPGWIMLAGAVLLGLLDRPLGLNLLDPMRGVLVFALLGLGLNVVTGFTGLLHLGMAAFMAIGAYAFAISTCDIYPFQIGFWPALGVTAVAGALAGFLLGAPTLGLRGDYLAIVTLGFGEIVQDVMKNLDAITKGTQGINPLPAPSLPVVGEFGTDERPWYWLFLALLVLAVKLCRNLERSRTGRAWLAVREDQLAASCMGITPIPVKMYAFATGAALAALAGGLWASLYQSTGEPGNYDFQISILALCIVIVGGMGSIDGVLVGALTMIGVANIALPKLASWLQAQGIVNPSNVLGSPNNWKYLVFGVVLMVMMRVRPDGLLPARLERAGGGS
ncbi:MAG: branched-chain amino acid ABC transporter permease [Planctomycetes bacterium]|nr:branched-chain amino acid ABC transporter permease [Planctomycetota bacterium]